ncbi:YeiH family protein [Corynebacterium alimapuense]|uniref:Putative sulfate exporter family transporter n=1 Tax=Corynebacterium alimapuense TaxID=1576874 RepID=A0A3M8K705_9CORY|nr:putative sulfate exporter family transporter [Corynebacterium alimapuense]RNE48936.1 putative sulfate exporter family transporter [Corynebacterium alimapuense]
MPTDDTVTETSAFHRARQRSIPLLPGLGACAIAVLISLGVHSLVPSLPAMTIAVVLGILVANLPGISLLTRGVLSPGLGFAGKKLMRAGIVMLGLKLSIVDILGLGWAAFGIVVAIVLLAFAGTYLVGKLFKLPGDAPLLIAAGFSICGASAIGAMAGARRVRPTDTVMPVALVTLCGTLAIAVLPLLMEPLSLNNIQFGQWVGASVHDVGQVVATAQVAGPAALAAALVIKLTRVMLLAPIVFFAAMGTRRSAKNSQHDNGEAEKPAPLPPLIPLFIIGFALMIGIRSLGILSPEMLEAGAILQDVFLGAALFGLGAAVSIRELLSSGMRGIMVALLSWILIGTLGYAGVQLMSI